MKTGFAIFILTAVILLAPTGSALAKKSEAPGQVKKAEILGELGVTAGSGVQNQGKSIKAPGRVKKTTQSQNGANFSNQGVETNTASNALSSAHSSKCGNTGAIWTVSSPDVQQNVNHYKVGDSVYLNGMNFPCTEVDYAIWTNPPNPQNGTMVASGTIQLVNGSINTVLIWTIPAEVKSGVYKVVVTSCCGTKSDNFLVKKVKVHVPPCDGDENGKDIEDQDGDDEEEENGEVAGDKDEAKGGVPVGDLPAAGPGMGILALISLAALIISPKIRREVLAELKR